MLCTYPTLITHAGKSRHDNSFETTLRAKMTLYLLSPPVCSGVILYAICHYFERTIKETVADQQNFTVTVLAEDLDRKFETTHNC